MLKTGKGVEGWRGSAKSTGCFSQRTWVLFLRSTGRLATAYNSSSKGLHTLSGLFVDSSHTYMHAGTQSYT